EQNACHERDQPDHVDEDNAPGQAGEALLDEELPGMAQNAGNTADQQDLPSAVEKAADASDQPTERVRKAFDLDPGYDRKDPPGPRPCSSSAGGGLRGRRFSSVDDPIEHLAFQRFRTCALWRALCPVPAANSAASHFLEAITDAVQRLDHVEIIVALL